MEAALIPIDEIALRILRFENETMRNIGIDRQGADHKLTDLHPSVPMAPNCCMLDGPIRYFITKNKGEFKGHLTIEPVENERYQIHNGYLLIESGGLPKTFLESMVGKTLDEIIQIGPYQPLVTGLKVTSFSDEIMQKLFLDIQVSNAGWIGDPDAEDAKRRKAGTWPL